MIKDISRTKMFLIGCSVPSLFFILFKISKILGLNLDSVFEVVTVGFLFLSFPWSIPSFAFVSELNSLIGSTFRSCFQTASLIIGFGINFLLLLKLGIHYWIKVVLKFAILLVMIGILFTIWMILHVFI